MSLRITYSRQEALRKRISCIVVILGLTLGLFISKHYINAAEQVESYEYFEDNYIAAYNEIKEQNNLYKDLINPNRKLIGIPLDLNKFHIDNLDYKESALLLTKHIPMPPDELEMILQYCNMKRINPAIIFALIKKESNFNTNLTNPLSSARGYGQVIRRTGEIFYKKAFNASNYNHDYMFNPDYSIPVIFEYMEYLMKSYNGSIRQSLEMYYGHKLKSHRVNYANSVIKQAYNYCDSLSLVIEIDPSEYYKFDLTKDTIMLSRNKF